MSVSYTHLDVYKRQALCHDWRLHFYSHASCEAWLGRFLNRLSDVIDFYSHASCEAWHITAYPTTHSSWISTHTPHARRDPETRGNNIFNNISTHTPHARRDNIFSVNDFLQSKFLLTRLMRGVTNQQSAALHKRQNFYSHASCEAWQNNWLWCGVCCYFYSHASCEAWQCWTKFTIRNLNFYSHASCEAWLLEQRGKDLREKFLLTRLMRGVTLNEAIFNYGGDDFYSHASCEAWLRVLHFRQL